MCWNVHNIPYAPVLSCHVFGSWSAGRVVSRVWQLKCMTSSVSGTHLVRMLDMHTEAQLLQDPSFRFDHLVFGIYVVLIKYQWTCTPGLWKESNKKENVFLPFNLKNRPRKCPSAFFDSFSIFPFNQLKATGPTVCLILCWGLWTPMVPVKAFGFCRQISESLSITTYHSFNRNINSDHHHHHWEETHLLQTQLSNLHCKFKDIYKCFATTTKHCPSSPCLPNW